MASLPPQVAPVMSQPIISFANLFEVHQRQRKRIANRENHGNASGWSQSERAWFNYQAPLSNVPVRFPSFEIPQIIRRLGPVAFAGRRYPTLYDQFRRALLDRSFAASGGRVV